jgi:hypothetical protein
MRRLLLLFTHVLALALGFALGIYALPILTAPPGPDSAALSQAAASAEFTAQFDRNLKGSDFLHWGEGTLHVMPQKIAHLGRLSPGPDYKLYLTTEFVDDEASFLKLKDKAARIGDVKTFDGFLLDVPAGIDVASYTTAVVWCEAFSEFISAAKYR